MRVIGSVGEPRSQRNGWSQTLGDYVELTWHGTPEYAQATYAALRLNCAECELDVEGARGLVRARFVSSTEPGGEEILRVELRMGRNDVQKSIFEPGPDGYIPGVSDSDIAFIKAIIENPDDGQLVIDFEQTASAAALALLDLALAGVQYRIVSQRVLIQSTTASGNFQWPAVGNQESILTRATMLAMLRAVPSFQVPNNPGDPPTGFGYGWRLSPPTYESSSDGHSNEVLEFEFGLWPTQLFGDPI